MKKLILCLILSCFGFQDMLLFSQDYKQVEEKLKAKYSYVLYYESDSCFQIRQNDKNGICDLSGKEIIPPIYTQVFKVSYIDYGVYYHVANGNRAGISDLTGKIIIYPDKYTHVCRQDGYFDVIINDKRGVCDLGGKEIVPCQFADIKYDFYEKKFQVKHSKADTNYIDNANYTPINLHQTIAQSDATINIIRNRYKTDKIAYHFHSASNGYYSVKLNDKEGICDLNGRELMAPNKYNSVIYDKQSGYYAVKIGDKAGLCNLTGKEIIAPDKYTDIYTYEAKDGYYKVKIDDKVGLCDLKGKEIFSPNKYTEISTYEAKDGYYAVKIGDKAGLCDLTGKEIIAPNKYTDIYTFDAKKGYCHVKIGAKEGLCDLNGNLISDPNEQIAQVEEGIKLSGNWSYNIDYSQQTVSIKGDKIINKSTGGKSGTIKISLYLTSSQYTGGSITGYALTSYKFDQLSVGYQYNDINKLLNYDVNPPSDSYYVTLLLLEYTDNGFVIKDYLNFDGTIAFDSRKTERVLNAIAAGLNAASNSLNNYNNSNNNNQYTNPNNTNNNRSNGHMETVVCDICHGTGKSATKEYPPTFGQGRDIMKTSCPYCGDIYVHSHKNCFSCKGTGKVQKWVP